MNPKTVLITGGANGLGKRIVLFLLKKEYKVIIIDKTEKNELSDDLKNIDYFKLDLSNLNMVEQFINENIINNKLNIDILIINAAPRVFKPFEQFTINEIKTLSNASFISSLLLINAISKKMFLNNFGRLIIISSISGLKGYSTGSIYCSFKSAWITFHESFYRELRAINNVTINTICPDSFSKIGDSKLNEYVVNKILTTISDSISKNTSNIHYHAKFNKKVNLIKIFISKYLKIIIR